MKSTITLKSIVSSMDKGLGIVLLCVSVLGFVGLVIFGILTFGITSLDQTTGICYDGLGRELSPAPLFIRLILGGDRMWPGLFWSVVDWVISISSFIVFIFIGAIGYWRVKGGNL